MRGLAELMGHKLRDYLAPFFVALSGRASATPLFQTMEILGRDLVLARLRNAVTVLGGLSGKQDKKWRRAYDEAVAGPDGIVEE